MDTQEAQTAERAGRNGLSARHEGSPSDSDSHPLFPRNLPPGGAQANPKAPGPRQTPKPRGQRRRTRRREEDEDEEQEQEEEEQGGAGGGEGRGRRRGE